MGADYIPEDNIFSRITKERTRKLLEDCVAANHNSIRVWGGGYYPDDYFFDICDELGLSLGFSITTFSSSSGRYSLPPGEYTLTFKRPAMCSAVPKSPLSSKAAVLSLLSGVHSPIRYIREENEKIYTGGSADAMEGFPHLRKAHCMFGWDWGPRLPDLSR